MKSPLVIMTRACLASLSPSVHSSSGLEEPRGAPARRARPSVSFFLGVSLSLSLSASEPAQPQNWRQARMAAQR